MLNRNSLPPIPVLMGPTGSGKTAAAVARAREFPLTAIVADLRQVVSGMAIGSAHPSPEELAALPHLMLGLFHPACDVTVHKWRVLALPAIAQVLAERRIPILVGGSGLAIKTLVENVVYDAPPAPILRPALLAWVRDSGLSAVLNLMRESIAPLLKPESFTNPQRVVRAIERWAYLNRREIAALERRVIHFGGNGGGRGHESAQSALAGDSIGAVPSGVIDALIMQIAAWEKSREGPGQPEGRSREYKIFALAPDRTWLAARIHARARAMFYGGFLDEVRALLDAGMPRTARALLGHGYPEAIAVLDGRMTVEAAIERTAVITRQYAKRQTTWLRHKMGDVTFLPVGPDCPPEKAVDEAAKWIRIRWDT